MIILMIHYTVTLLTRVFFWRSRVFFRAGGAAGLFFCNRINYSIKIVREPLFLLRFLFFFDSINGVFVTYVVVIFDVLSDLVLFLCFLAVTYP